MKEIHPNHLLSQQLCASVRHPAKNILAVIPIWCVPSLKYLLINTTVQPISHLLKEYSRDIIIEGKLLVLFFRFTLSIFEDLLCINQLKVGRKEDFDTLVIYLSFKNIF